MLSAATYNIADKIFHGAFQCPELLNYIAKGQYLNGRSFLPARSFLSRFKGLNIE